MSKPIFYFDKLKTWDKLTIVLYIFLSLGIWYYLDKTTVSTTQRDLIFGYALGTQLFLYFFNYKSLRNLTVFFIWFLFSIFHFLAYLQLKNISTFHFAKGNAVTGLRNTVILLILFQFLRFISAKTQGQELVALSRSRTDLFDDRRITVIDIIIFFVYLGATALLLFNE